MKAAVVEAFGQSPVYREFPEPSARADEVIVSVHAAAVSPLVRAQAAGKHYASGKPPFIPGADGVGRLEDGRRVYCAFPRPPFGAMAERVAVKAAYTVALPDDIADITAAALGNPGMASWVALSERVHIQAGESVLINGATGASGRLAIRIARHLGAGRVIATGRDPASEKDLRALGADGFISISQPHDNLIETFRREIDSGVDIVLDYVWGASAEAFFAAVTGRRAGEAEPRIRFVNIGALGSATVSLPAAALRSSGLELLGSGLGIAYETLVRSVGSMLRAAHGAHFSIDVEPIPLSRVETAWAVASKARLVLTM